MDVSIISKRYAQALFDLALEMNIVERVKDDMNLVLAVTKENPQFKRLLASPIIPPGKKSKILRRIFEKHINRLSLRFLELVTQKEREVYMVNIADSFITRYKKYKNIITVKLTTAYTIDGDTRKEILDLLKEATDKHIELVEVVDKKIIGGFVLTLEDSQYDASLRKKIYRLGKAFEKNLYIKGF